MMIVADSQMVTGHSIVVHWKKKLWKLEQFAPVSFGIFQLFLVESFFAARQYCSIARLVLSDYNVVILPHLTSES